MAPLIVGTLVTVAVVSAACASGHAILYKRDVRAAIGWAGFIWIAPLAGPLIYFLFGVNRIRRHAAGLRPPHRRRPGARARRRCESDSSPYERVGDRVLGYPMTEHNRVAIHETGEEAFAAMLGAIDRARRSVTLSTYIFELDATGTRTVESLIAAAKRGVEVRVLIDDVGSRTSGRKIVAMLESAGVRAALFLPVRLPRMRRLNLRNHRKLLVLDGATAFTGGMNVADGYALRTSVSPIVDTQFELEGAVVYDLQETFADDWMFTTGEILEGDRWFAGSGRCGGVAARAIADGPDESFEMGRWVMLGAIGAARRSIRIVTPYFVPDGAFIIALDVAALRGVNVEIIIPETLDHPAVKWASNALLWQLLEKGCRVWFTPPPFDHSKLFTVDGIWTFFGSANWDARSIRLNFELNVEVLDEEFTSIVDRMIDSRRSSGREITLAEVDARSIPIRLRDGIARLASPYL